MWLQQETELQKRFTDDVTGCLWWKWLLAQEPCDREGYIVRFNVWYTNCKSVRNTDVHGVNGTGLFRCLRLAKFLDQFLSFETQQWCLNVLQRCAWGVGKLSPFNSQYTAIVYSWLNILQSVGPLEIIGCSHGSRGKAKQKLVKFPGLETVNLALAAQTNAGLPCSVLWPLFWHLRTKRHWHIAQNIMVIRELPLGSSWTSPQRAVRSPPCQTTWTGHPEPENAPPHTSPVFPVAEWEAWSCCSRQYLRRSPSGQVSSPPSRSPCRPSREWTYILTGPGEWGKKRRQLRGGLPHLPLVECSRDKPSASSSFPSGEEDDGCTERVSKVYVMRIRRKLTLRTFSVSQTGRTLVAKRLAVACKNLFALQVHKRWFSQREMWGVMWGSPDV